MTDADGSSGETDRYWIAGQGNGGTCDVYHTDRDCPMLQRADTIHEWEIVAIKDNRKHCQVCAGEVEQPEQDYSYIKSLKEAAE